jgi:hypothetical protein
MYRVGFGDAYLLTFEYDAPLEDGRQQRHVVVDCGTTKRDETGPRIDEVATLIAEHCGGQLDVLVVTHRHRDHLSAFANDKAVKALDPLAPKLVVRPWTDDPAIPIDATAPATGAAANLDDRSRRFAASLRAGQDAAALIGAALQHDIRTTRGMRRELGTLALDQIKNKEAVDHLDALAAAAEATYVAFGGDTRISEFVPGVRVDVLGPPTVAQWPQVTSQRSEDPDEFWMLHRSLVDNGFSEAGIDPVDPSRWAVLLDDNGLGPARWLLERLDEQRVASLLRIVRTFDSALNNTSLVLLVTAGDRRLLFSGDAQIENWSFCLQNIQEMQEIRAALGTIDLYKVGHHGSRNATPRSLFALWNGDGPRRPMTALMSTLAGVHGERAATAVPRATLVKALRERATLHATDELDDGVPFVRVAARTDRDEMFTAEHVPA